MEHIPFPEDALFPRPEVPYICDDDFEEILHEVPFEQYPEIKGIDIQTASYDTYDAPRLQCFLQEWAYFGLLRECLRTRNVDMRISDFVRFNGRGMKTLTSVRLPDLFKKWRDALNAPAYAVADQVDDQRRRIKTLISVALPTIRRCHETLDFATDSVRYFARGEAVHLAICVLLEGIQMIFYEFSLSNPVNNHYEVVDAELIFIMTKFPPLVARLKLAGWCPSVVGAFSPGYNSLLLYIAAMKHPDYHETNRCNTYICGALDVSDMRYSTKCIPECSGCKNFIGPNVQATAEILEKGGIPVLTIDVLDGSPHVAVHDSRDCDVYIALSHVWAHGLGNRTSNSLPPCQLRRIATITHKVSNAQRHNPNFAQQEMFYTDTSTTCVANRRTFSSAAFWIDTLCVPVPNPSLPISGPHLGLQRAEMLRKMAIARMAQTYRGAQRVLVLDEISRHFGRQPATRNIYDLIIRLSTSGWFGRLWTLQEAVLAREDLYFNFKDDVISWYELMNRSGQLDPSLSLMQTSLFSTSLTKQLMSITPIRAGRGSTSRKWDSQGRTLHVLTQVRSRSTSKAADEATCLATLLNLSLSSILELESHDERMQTFYTLLGEKTCIELLFVAGERLQVQGFRWAPKTLMARPNVLDDPTLRPALGIYRENPHLMPTVQRTPQGLKIEQLVSWQIVTPLTDEFIGSAPLFFAVYEENEKREEMLNVHRVRLLQQQPGQEIIKIHQMKPKEASYSIVWHPYSQLFGDRRCGVLLRVSQSHSGVSFGTYIDPVITSTLRERGFNMDMELLMQQAREGKLITAFVHHKGSWCIG